jgi:hypothetical protein
VVLGGILLGLTGCGGGMEEGVPKNAEYKPIQIPDSMKNMGAKAAVKAGTPGKTAP